MSPATVITQATADGVRLSLSATGSIKASGDSAAVNRWLPIIREHKAEIIELLKAGDSNQSTISRGWLFHFADRHDLPVTFVPAVTHVAALACYPDAVAAEPIAERPWRKPTKAESDEITTLVKAAFRDDTDDDHKEALATALADPDGALLCYRTIAKQRGASIAKPLAET